MSKIAEQLQIRNLRDSLAPVKNPGDDPGSEVESTTAVTNVPPSNLLTENKSRSKNGRGRCGRHRRHVGGVLSEERGTLVTLPLGQASPESFIGQMSVLHSNFRNPKYVVGFGGLSNVLHL